MQNIFFMQNPFFIKELRPQVLKSIETAQKFIVSVFPSETSLEIDFSGNVFSEVISKRRKCRKMLFIDASYKCLPTFSTNARMAAMVYVFCLGSAESKSILSSLFDEIWRLNT